MRRAAAGYSDGLGIVAHRAFAEKGAERIARMLVKGGVLVDVKSAFARETLPPDCTYWGL